jgi:hypothetical protein
MSTIIWPAVPGATGYTVSRNGHVVTSTRSATQVHGLKVAAGDTITIAATVPTPPPPSSSGSVTGRWFTSDSYINRGFPSPPTIDPNSPAMMAQLVKQASQGVYFNTDANSVAVYVVPGSTPDVRVTQTRDGSVVQAPFTATMKPAGSPSNSDAHCVAMLDEQGWYWETELYTINGPFTCQGICTGNVITGDGTPPAEGQISDLPTPVGLLRPRDFTAPFPLDHGLRCAIPTASTKAVWPATRSDGSNSGLIPMGSCIWLPPTVDLSGLDPYQTVAAWCWQYGGMWCGDSNGNTNAVTCFVEATTDGSTYPFTGLSLPLSLLEQAHVLVPQTP